MTREIRRLKEVGNDGEDQKGLMFESVQGINTDTEVFF